MSTRQLRPKRQNRKSPNMRDKLASALLHIKRGVEGDDWLIKGDLRTASAREIVASVDFDHVRRWAEGGENIPQNLQPLPRAEHREKSRKDTTEIAKGKRYGAKEAEHRERLAAKFNGDLGDLIKKEAMVQRRKYPSRYRKKLNGQVVDRVTGEMVGGRS